MYWVKTPGTGLPTTTQAREANTKAERAGKTAKKTSDEYYLDSNYSQPEKQSDYSENRVIS